MTQLDLSGARLPPFEHQRIGTEKLVRWSQPEVGRVHGGSFGLFDEMGAGKSKQTIDATIVLYLAREIDRVIVLAPGAAVEDVWYDPDGSELAKHLWDSIDARVGRYHQRFREWRWRGGTDTHGLQWILSNYEYVRGEGNLAPLVRFAREGKTLLALDESSFVKSHQALQTQAVLELRQHCRRVVLLNGTPVAHSPLDLYAQASIMDPRILGCRRFFEFRARYAVMGGFQGRQVLGWQNIEDLQRRLAPYVLQRKTADCIDMPPEIPPVTIGVPLEERTWSVYKEMRDELVAWLDGQTVAVSVHAAVKAMRLCQITSGFVGGLMERPDDGWDGGFDDLPDDDQTAVDDRPDFVPRTTRGLDQVGAGPARSSRQRSLNTSLLAPVPGPVEGTREVGREKLDATLAWLAERWAFDPNLKLLVWCAFRPELDRLAVAVRDRFPRVALERLWGGMTKTDKSRAVRLLDPRFAPRGPAVLVGTQATGKMAFNFTAAHHQLYTSRVRSLMVARQSAARVKRPGQTRPVWSGDLVATGPRGQKTIDKTVLLALRNQEDVATWTCAAWVRALNEE